LHPRAVYGIAFSRTVFVFDSEPGVGTCLIGFSLHYLLIHLFFDSVLVCTSVMVMAPFTGIPSRVASNRPSRASSTVQDIVKKRDKQFKIETERVVAKRRKLHTHVCSLFRLYQATY